MHAASPGSQLHQKGCACSYNQSLSKALCQDSCALQHDHYDAFPPNPLLIALYCLYMVCVLQLGKLVLVCRYKASAPDL